MKKLLTLGLAFALSLGLVAPVHAAAPTPEEKKQVVEELVKEYYDEVYASTVNPYAELQTKVEGTSLLIKELEWEIQQLTALEQTEEVTALIADKQAKLDELNTAYEGYVAEVDAAREAVELEKNKNEAALEKLVTTKGKALVSDVKKIAISGAVMAGADVAIAAEKQIIAYYEQQLANNQAKIDEYDALIKEQEGYIADCQEVIDEAEAQIIPTVVAEEYNATANDKGEFTVDGINYVATLEDGKVVITKQDTPYAGTSLDDLKKGIADGIEYEASVSYNSISLTAAVIDDNGTIKIQSNDLKKLGVSATTELQYSTDNGYYFQIKVKIGFISVKIPVNVAITEKAHEVNSIDLTETESEEIQALLDTIDTENAIIEGCEAVIEEIEAEQAPYQETVDELTEKLYGQTALSSAILLIAEGDYTRAALKAAEAVIKGEISAQAASDLIALAKAIAAGTITAEELETLVDLLQEINLSESVKLQLLQIVLEKATEAHNEGLASLEADLQNIRSDLKKAVKAYIYSEIKLVSIQEIDNIINAINE